MNKINTTRIDVIVNLIRTFVLTLLSFVTFPWVCRALGDSVLGSYTWALTFVSYFLILAKIGIPNIALRECVKVRDDKEKLSNRVQAFFILQSIATIGSFLLMLFLVLIVPSLHSSDPVNLDALIFLLSINFLSGAFSFEWVYIALEKQLYMSVRSIGVLTISAMLVIIFVTNPGDVYIYALISVGVTILTSIANVIFLHRYISFKKTLPYNFKQYAKPLLVLFSLSFTVSLYNQTDTFILGIIDEGKNEVGSYSVGIKGIDIIIGILSNLGTVFIPRSNYYWNVEDKQYFKRLNKYSLNICLFIVVPAIVTMTVLAIPICALISGNYHLGTSISDSYIDSYMVLMILSPMMLTYSIGEIIYGQILLPQKKEKYYLFAILLGTIVNAGLSVLLGKFVFNEHPAIGVAIGTVLTDLVICVFLIAISWKWIKVALFNKNTLKIILSGVVITGLSLGLYFGVFPLLTMDISQAWKAILEILITLVVDGLAYLGLLIALKEDLVHSFIKTKKVSQNV